MNSLPTFPQIHNEIPLQLGLRQAETDSLQNIDSTALVAMDVDDDEGEEDAKDEANAQGASTNKKATSNKVVKSK